MRGLKDRVIILTGGAGGIGRATAGRLAEEGAKVAILDLNGDGAATAAAEPPDEPPGTRVRSCGVFVGP